MPGAVPRSGEGTNSDARERIGGATVKTVGSSVWNKPPSGEGLENVALTNDVSIASVVSRVIGVGCGGGRRFRAIGIDRRNVVS